MIATPPKTDGVDSHFIDRMEADAVRRRRLIRIRDQFERVLLRALTDGVLVFDRDGKPVMDASGKPCTTMVSAAFMSVARNYLHDVAPDIARHQHGAFFEALKQVRDRNRSEFAAEPDEGEEEIE